MKKNTFLIYNDTVHCLYSSKNMAELRDNALYRLRMLIPYSYASILLADTSSDAQILYQEEPFCIPTSFAEAEMEYIKHSEEDPLLWVTGSHESTLVRESDLLDDESRLQSPLYLHCYKKYNIFDTLQLSIVYNQIFLGVLTLFRTRIDGCFTEDDMFFLRSLGTHLNLAMYHILKEPDTKDRQETLAELSQKFELTNRETEILSLIFDFKSMSDISEELELRENTVQKHMQNIFRKMNVSSKWELLQFR